VTIPNGFNTRKTLDLLKKGAKIHINNNHKKYIILRDGTVIVLPAATRD